MKKKKGEMPIKIGKVGSWYDVYYTESVKISYSKKEFESMFGKFGFTQYRVCSCVKKFCELFSC